MYTISISEVQRRIIMQALTHLGSSSESENLKNEPGDIEHGGYKTAQEELCAMICMFGTLDRDEKESPGVVHGFCL